MNFIGPGILDPIAKEAIRVALVSIVGDTDASSVTVTVSTPTADPTVDWSSRVVTPTTSADSVSALRVPEGGKLPKPTLRAAAQDSGGIQSRMFLYHVMAVDLSATPTTSTVITDGGDRFAVVEVISDPLGLMHLLKARRAP